MKFFRAVKAQIYLNRQFSRNGEERDIVFLNAGLNLKYGIIRYFLLFFQ